MKKDGTPVRATAFKDKLFDEIISRLDLSEPKQILELACGTGWLCYKISEMLNGEGRVVGIDISNNAIAMATDGLSDFSFSNLEFKVKDVHNMEYDTCFDYVISINALHHFSDRPEVFRKVKRSLKHGGSFILVDYNAESLLMRIFDKLSPDHGGPIHFLTPDQVESLYLSQDFNNITLERKTLYGIFSIMVGSGEIS